MDNPKPYRDLQEEYMVHFAKLSDEDKNRHLTIIMAWLLKILVNKLEEEAEALNLEQVAHANQNAIDATFYELLEGEEED